MSSLKEKAINSVIWSSIERFSVQGVQFIISLLIARILLPSDYGLVAMLGIFIAVAQSFVDSGFANALIQRQNRTQADYSTVFYFNIVISVIVYASLWLISPWIASFYNEPQLEIITKVFSLNIVISSLAIVQQAQLTIKLNFKLQTKISLIAVIISGIIGVWMAYRGYGVWALVFQTLLHNILNTGLLWVLSHWHPSWCFSLKSFRILFSFGSKLLLAGLLHTLYINVYTLVIGKKYAVADLGFYNRASSFANIISDTLTTVITRAMYPIQCSLQNDERLYTSFLSYIRMSCYISFPLMIGMLVLAKPMVLVLLTEKWVFSSELLQILCLARMWNILMGINYNLLNAMGRTDYTLKSEIYKKIVAFIILIATLPFGLKILCWGLVLYSWADLFIITRYTQKTIRIGLWVELKTLMPILFLSAGMGIAIWISGFLCEGSLSKLLVGFITGCVFYVGLSHFFRFEELSTIKKIIRRIL